MHDELEEFALGGFQTHIDKTDSIKKILLIDDEEILITVSTHMLEKLGHIVKSNQSSIEALEEFRNNPDDYDLIITDQTMPNMTGEVLIREIRKIRPDISIIMTSGFSESITPAIIEQLGIKAFLPKPVTLEELSGAILKISKDQTQEVVS